MSAPLMVKFAASIEAWRCSWDKSPVWMRRGGVRERQSEGERQREGERDRGRERGRDG